MKFQTHIHHLFDAIKTDRITGGFSKEARAGWRDRLRRDLPLMQSLPVFVVRDAVDDVFDGEMMNLTLDAWIEGRISIPYPHLLIEFHVSDVLDDEGAPASDGVWVVCLSLNPDTGDAEALLFIAHVDSLRDWSVAPFASRLWRGHGETELGLAMPEDLERLTDPFVQDILPDILKDTRAALVAACAVIMLLDSPAVEVERVAVPREINRNRRIMKRSPVPDHTVLRLPRLAYVGESDGTGTHRRPRTHWRRPHTRHLASGKTADIPLTLVARKEDEPPPPMPVTEITLR